MNKSSEYHTLADQEKNEILNTQSYPTIQYCTMANGEVGMYLPKVFINISAAWHGYQFQVNFGWV